MPQPQSLSLEKELTRRHADDLSELQQRAPPAIHPG